MAQTVEGGFLRVGSDGRALTLMLKLKQAGIAAILVSHSNKSEDNYRGSTAIAATFEVILGLKRAEDPRVDRRYSAGFLIKADKFRGRRDDTMEDQKGVPSRRQVGTRRH